MFTKWKYVLTSPTYITDKHPQLNEFMTQISSTPELANLYESIQKDNSNSMDNFGYASSGMAMDISWRLGRREAGHGEAATTNLSNSVVGNKKRVGEHQIHENGASVFKVARVKHWKNAKRKRI